MTKPSPGGLGAVAARFVALGLLLVSELILVQVLFDQHIILESSRWWAQLLWYYPVLFNLAFGCWAAVALVGHRALREAFAASSTSDDGGRSLRRALMAHGAFAFAFYELTVAGLRSGLAASPWGDWWFLAWSTCGLAAFGAWCLALLPMTFWRGCRRIGVDKTLIGVALGFAVWHGQEALGGGLYEATGAATLRLVAGMLKALGYEVVLDEAGHTVGTPAFPAWLSAGCLGYEGIGLVVTFCSVYLYANRRNLAFPRSLLLVPLAAVVSWLMNAVRVVGLILIGTSRGELGVEGFHSVAGWLYFAAIIGGVIVLSQRPWFAKDPAVAPADRPIVNPAAFYLLPMLCLVATALLARVFTRGFDTLYPLRLLVAASVLWLYRERLAGLGWRGSAWAAAAGTVTFVVWMAFDVPTASAIPGGLSGLPTWAAVGWLFCRVVGSSLTVPLAEELAFRGYLARKLFSADFEAVPIGRFSVFSILTSSILFGAMHGRWLAGTIAGLIFAATLCRRGRLADAVVAHGTANALIAVYVLAVRDWSLWD